MNRFLKLSTWQMIIRSRIIDWKNNREEWCKERRRLCNKCPHNTKNKLNNTFFNKFMMLIQFTKSVCSICGCAINKKTVVPMSTCSKEEINETPEWRSIVRTKYKEKYGIE